VLPATVESAIRLTLLLLATTASAGLLDRGERSKQRAACDAGDRVACDALKCHDGNNDKCLYMGLRAVKAGQVDQALRVFDHACSEDLAGACVEAGWLYSGLGPGDPTNPALGRERLAKACELGEPRGCRSLASFYGQDAFQHMSRWSTYRRQCSETVDGQAEIPGACYVAGWFWLEGLGVKADRAQACRSLTQGCDAGSGAACEAALDHCG